eukprot:gene11311-14203_t
MGPLSSGIACGELVGLGYMGQSVRAPNASRAAAAARPFRPATDSGETEEGDGLPAAPPVLLRVGGAELTDAGMPLAEAGIAAEARVEFVSAPDDAEPAAAGEPIGAVGISAEAPPRGIGTNAFYATISGLQRLWITAYPPRPSIKPPPLPLFVTMPGGKTVAVEVAADTTVGALAAAAAAQHLRGIYL